jgi:hypothetical protein
MSNTRTPSFRTPVRHGNGFLILSVLIVMGIILYLMFGKMGGTTYMDQVKKTRDNGRETARQIRTEQMSLLIAMYRESNKKLPVKVEDLESPGAFNDGWGKEMTFKFEEVNGKTKIIYHSAGSDGDMGNADDVDYTDWVPY